MTREPAQKQRCACGGIVRAGGECAACHARRLQRQARAPAPAATPPSVRDALRSAGRPFEPAVRAEMEAHFGHDFSRVRVHTDAKAAESAESVGANAYTVGSSVVLGQGLYAPHTHRGKKLLAHELAHVIQQSRSAGRSGASERRLEQDANDAANAVGTAGRAQVTASAAPYLARQPSDAGPHGVSLVEISCAINEIRFHTPKRVIAYELTDCELDNGDYEAHVVVDRHKRTVKFDLGKGAPEGVRFSFNYFVGPDQPAPIDLLRGQSTVHVVATNLPARDAEATPPPAPVAPDLTANVAHITPEEAQQRCEANDLRVKTFPFRSTRFGAAPIDAWRDGQYIRVKQPAYVRTNDDFRDQVRTLPVETFTTSGVRLYRDEIVRVHVYESPWWKPNITGSTDWDREREFCVTGERMLKIADASTNATLFNIALTGVEATTLFVPVGKLAAPLAQAGRTGLAATMIATADVAPTAFASVASRTATTIVEQQAETQIVNQTIRQTVAVAGREVTEAAIPRVAEVAVPRVGAGVASTVGTGVAVKGTDIAGDVLRDRVAPSPRPPIAGAEEIQVAEPEYRAALELVFPGQFADEIAVVVDGIGERAAQRAVADARFIAAVQSGNRTLAGTLYHSAAAQEARALPASALPSGWVIEAERVIQSGAGGSRADVLLRGPAREIIEFDWKTTGGSALSYGSRREMTRHAGQITTNVGGRLIRQESKSWIDYVRPLLPNEDW